ncbi:NACHT N-terminal helical domain 7-containing protein [Nonomuraea jabiensis]|uniref:NACHT N-terminal Helical domain-containing protein n=1 Tax=Nonomuraea jabiensis TaxID=882448 RepID=A0A7W9G0P8_9ACTN|nr:hypothetical protein [Nonomuraea jabiensis]MBB5774996.1 hypothetical protein [Nonomuraea jabiensis]
MRWIRAWDWAVTAFRPNSALPYFDAKNELIAHLRKLTNWLKERMKSSTRLEYEGLLAAAHAVIVMTAFTEELAERLEDLDAGGKWSRELRQWQDVGKGQSKRLRLVNWAAQSTIEPPGPTRPTEVVLEQIETVYGELSQQALDYLAGLRRWDELNESQRDRIKRSTLSKGFIERAIGRYRGHFFRLAAQAPAWSTAGSRRPARSSPRSASVERSSGPVREDTCARPRECLVVELWSADKSGRRQPAAPFMI